MPIAARHRNGRQRGNGNGEQLTADPVVAAGTSCEQSFLLLLCVAKSVPNEIARIQFEQNSRREVLSRGLPENNPWGRPVLHARLIKYRHPVFHNMGIIDRFSPGWDARCRAAKRCEC